MFKKGPIGEGPLKISENPYESLNSESQAGIYSITKENYEEVTGENFEEDLSESSRSYLLDFQTAVAQRLMEESDTIENLDQALETDWVYNMPSSASAKKGGFYI